MCTILHSNSPPPLYLSHTIVCPKHAAFQTKLPRDGHTMSQSQWTDRGGSKCLVNSRCSVSGTFSSEIGTPCDYGCLPHSCIPNAMVLVLMLIQIMDDYWLTCWFLPWKGNIQISSSQFSCSFHCFNIGVSGMKAFSLFVPSNWKINSRRTSVHLLMEFFWMFWRPGVRRKKKKSLPTEYGSQNPWPELI